MTANCTCMVGLDGTCKHVAALLFKLESAVHFNLNEPDASTSLLCSWKASRKHVDPAPISAICFKCHKSGNLPILGEPLVAAPANYTCTNPMAGPYGLTADQLQSLRSIHSEAVVHSNINYGSDESEDFHSSGTDSDSETQSNFLPGSITSLYDPTVFGQDISDQELQNKTIFRLY